MNIKGKLHKWHLEQVTAGGGMAARPPTRHHHWRRVVSRAAGEQ